ncbi:unnamed protein product [Lymnaea stagnalis]|uniref:Carboxylesterase type B domain-containing protein n=1 Tax=Lymnaea stagnalis TaxID=6523 RepID=A0AAV2ICK5_LYMST
MEHQTRSSIHATAFIIIAIVLHGPLPCRSSGTVITPNQNGTVYTGKLETVIFGSRNFVSAQFLGIPYAKPPIGELRFSKPELLQLNETYRATEFKNICYQKINPKDGCQAFQRMSEDCLYLNIYVPVPEGYITNTVSTGAPAMSTSAAAVTPKKESQFTTAATSVETETNTSTTETNTTAPTTTTPNTTTAPATTTLTTAKTSTEATETATTASTTTEKSTINPTSASTAPTSAETSARDTRDSSEIPDQSDGNDEGDTAPAETSLPLKNNRTLAVFIFIHGGAYFEGNANCYNGSVLAGFGDIIVVTINYRLGPLGFLSTDDDAIPGNLGLWDQHTAIKWVKQNIEHFGGDPTRITVGGQSAGSYSSIFQALNPQSDSLFQRVIAQSGTPVTKNSVIQKGYDTAFEVAKRHLCPVQSRGQSSAIKDCLMKINATDLVSVDAPNLIPSSLPLEPTLDGHFITSDPRQAISANSKPQNHFTNIDLLIGFDADDGEVVYRLWAILNANKFNNMTYLYEALTQPIPLNMVRQIVFEYLAESFEENIESYGSIIDAVVDRYSDWERPEDMVSLSNRVVAMLTDVFFLLPVAETALGHTKEVEDVPTAPAPPHSEYDSIRRRRRDADAELGGNSKRVNETRRGNTYVYKFKLSKTDPSFQTKWIRWFNGTNHGSEVRYVFGGVSSPEDIELSSAVMTYWSNFIKHGNPNQASASGTESGNVQSDQPTEDTSPSLVNWPSFTTDHQSFLEISPQPTTRGHLGSAVRHFWYDLVPNLKQAMQARYEAGVNSTKRTQDGNHQTQCNGGSQPGVPVWARVLLMTAVLALYDMY